MGKPKPSRYWPIILFLVCAFGLALLATCGGCGGESSSPPGTGTVSTTLSDPPTCQNTFKNIWITITRVRAHTSSSAGPNDSGWVNLVERTSNPMQLDLLNLSGGACVLTQLASTSGIPAGQFQQIRVHLLDNNPTSATTFPSPNHCGNQGFNCVVTSSGIQTLQLSSETQTGIKIPSGQIAGGKFVVTAGTVLDLNIDFDACSSIVQQGASQFRLKPVLRAAEVSLSSSINGRIVDNGTQTPIGDALVFLEQKDSFGIDRMIMQTQTKSDGTFIFCPVPTGSFDVVANAVISSSTATVVFNSTITLGVPARTVMGDIPLFIGPGVNNTPALVSGTITSTAGSSAAQVDVAISALQLANNFLVTIPPLPDSTPNVTTQTGCLPATQDCVQYNLNLPASNPFVGTFSTSPPTSYSMPAGAPFTYTINAQAFAPSPNSNPGVPDCTIPSIMDQVDVQAGNKVILDFQFTGCL